MLYFDDVSLAAVTSNSSSNPSSNNSSFSSQSSRGINKYLQQVMIQKDYEGLAHILLTNNNGDVKNTCEIIQTILNLLTLQGDQV